MTLVAASFQKESKPQASDLSTSRKTVSALQRASGGDSLCQCAGVALAVAISSIEVVASKQERERGREGERKPGDRG